MFQFESLSAFLSMDGHGVYVWASYAATLVPLAVIAWLPYSKKRVLIAQVQRQQRIDNPPQ
jgi:heme exporter protein D